MINDMYSNYSTIKKENSIEQIIKILEKESELWLKMNMIPRDCFQAIKKYSGYSIEELCQCGISKTTLNKYLYNVHSYEKYKVVRFLLFTNCPPKCSQHLLNICNCQLNLEKEEDKWIDFVINHYWHDEFEKNMAFLEKNNIKI